MECISRTLSLVGLILLGTSFFSVYGVDGDASGATGGSVASVEESTADDDSGVKPPAYLILSR